MVFLLETIMMKHHSKYIKVSALLLVLFLALHFTLPDQVTIAPPSARAEMSPTTEPAFQLSTGMSTSTEKKKEIEAPVQKPKEVVRPTPVVSTGEQVIAHVTAYSGVESCHYAGCPMASGKVAYVGAVACPSWYKLGTRVEILGEVYTCEDRTATRFDGRFDIFMGMTQEAYQKALRFGIKNLTVTILK